MLAEPRRKHLVGENSDVLRIVTKFGYVIAPIRSPHQVRLRSTAHSANVLYCKNARAHNALQKRKFSFRIKSA